MRDKSRRPSVAVPVACIAIAVACISGTGALAVGKTRVVTGEQLREPFGSFVNVPPGDIQIAEAKCPAGFTDVSGGFDEKGSITLNLLGSKPLVEGHTAVGWEVEVVNPPLGQPGEVQAVAFCGKYNHVSL